MNTKYRAREPIRKMGIYFNPLFMFPFSTIDTIMEEKNDIIAIAAIEKYWKFLGSTVTDEMVKGRFPVAVPANLLTKFRIITNRWKDREKSRGEITMTIAAMKIM